MLALLFGLSGAPPGEAAAPAAVERSRLPNGDRAALVEKRDLFLETVPRPGEGLITFSRRVTGSPKYAAEVAKANGNPKRILAGVRYRVPYLLLPPEGQLAVIRALFPGDKAGTDNWLHRTKGESLERVAEWFSATPKALGTLRAENKLGGGRLPAQTTVRIPNEILRAPFRSKAPVLAEARPAAPVALSVPPAVAAVATPAPPARVDPPAPGANAAAAPPAPLPVEATIGAEPVIVLKPGAAALPGVAAPAPTAAGLLQYGEDAKGKYALYPLHAGEALYSSVVVRFTGRLHSEDVRAIAGDIAERSGIADVTSIPIGFPVRIPFDVLLPEFLPPNDPRRLEYDVERRLSGQYKNEVKARGLDGVTVVLDAGHGGIDVGASMAGVWESLYVYDIALRVKKTLETETLATVKMTTRDGAAWTIADRDVLPFSRGHAVLTTPPFPITDTIIGVNLRWYLANSQYRHAKTEGSTPDKVVFISIHADSLHPTLRGATAYIPDAAGTAGTTRKNGASFTARKEVREQPQVSFSLQERQRSEGLSRDLAERIIAAFKHDGLGIHPFNPVRDRIFRGRRAWVPAVLRYNAIPAKLLLEVCNLANVEDRTLLTTRAFRQRVAGSVVDGLLSYFGAAR
ncbi:MAG: N-acetylmuramoyl-L-alanine amidase [Thermoanaerobaculia bacterium]